MKVKLEKLSNNENRLRTKTIIGDCDYLPELNKNFTMTSTPLDPIMDLRVVSTSPVIKIVNRSRTFIEFQTENSTYMVSVYQEDPNITKTWDDLT